MESDSVGPCRGMGLKPYITIILAMSCFNRNQMEGGRNPSFKKTVVKDQPPQTHTNKRKLSHVDISASSYFKTRSIVHQLRPHVIQVLQTPDFRNCKAAHELRTQMKLVMDLYNKMTTKTELGKLVSEKKSVLGKQSVRHQCGEAQPPKQRSRITAETEPLTSINSQMNPDYGLDIRGSYVVGGSAVGWNFITWASSGPVYHGLTKELYRRICKKSGSGDVPRATEAL